MRFFLLLVIQFYSHDICLDTRQAQAAITSKDTSPSPGTKYNTKCNRTLQLVFQAEEALSDDDDHGISFTLLRTAYNSFTYYHFNGLIIKTRFATILRRYILFMNLRI